MPGRVAMQVVAFTGLLFFVLPSLVFAQTGEGWDVLLARPRWQFVAWAVLAAPFASTAVQGVVEFCRHGGTPLPLDPPRRLVRTGPYAYLANPMQFGATVLLAGWGALLASPAIVAASAMAAVFSSGLAAWSEERDLHGRFGDDWSDYRRGVRAWIPSWRPSVAVPATAFVSAGCDPCREVAGFLVRRRLAGIEIVAAETCAPTVVRLTYEDEAGRASGIAAIGRSLERANLAWAVASWLARLPGIQQGLQLVADAVGAGPRPLGAIDRAEPAPGTPPSRSPGDGDTSALPALRRATSTLQPVAAGKRGDQEPRG